MGTQQNRHKGSAKIQSPVILPQPKHYKSGRGELRLTNGFPIFLPAKAEIDRSLLVAATIAQQEILDRTGIKLRIERPRQVDSKNPAIQCRIDPSAALFPKRNTAEDAYHLKVRATGVVISAPSTKGLRHGLQTFCQLVSERGRIQATDVRDQPDFRDRAVMLDISRGKVPTLKTLKALVVLFSRLRLNVFMLYIEHTFDFRSHPEIGEGASPLNGEEMLALDEYATDRGVELIPCLQSLGHMERVLGMDRYAELAESDRLWSLSPSHPGTYEFLQDLYDEFLPLFRSPRFNANCDEPFDLGRGQSAERCPNKSPGVLFVEHVNTLKKMSESHGKQLLIWADFANTHPSELARLDRDVVLLDWWYEASFDGDRLGKLRKKGFEVWACPGTSTWNCLFPRVDNSLENITRWSDAGRKHGATGLLNTDWGDFGHYNALGVSLHSYAWGAQQSWSGNLDPKSFDRAFGKLVFREDSPKLGQLYRKLGAIHAAGFHVANGSALQYLYFDDLGRSFFLQHGKKKVLEASARKLEPILRATKSSVFTKADDDFNGLARQELSWAANATHLAVNKSLLAIEYNDWRSDSKTLTAPARRKLSRRLMQLAEEQAEQLSELKSLWLARNAISDFNTIEKRLRRSIAGLRRGARKLRQSQAPKPPKPTVIDMLTVYEEVRQEMGMKPR